MEKNITYIKLSLDDKLLVFPPYMIFRHCLKGCLVIEKHDLMDELLFDAIR